MKHFIYLTIALFAAFSLASCNDDDTIDEAWKDANLKAYNDTIKNAGYKDVRLTFHATDGTGPLGVYFKSLKEGTGTEHPLQTSKVKVLYYGYYYNGTVFDTGSSSNNIPVEFLTVATVRGFSYALQNMVVGDHWKICIPYYLGYGVSGNIDSYGNVLLKGYTTLFFDVELVSITQYP
ncbi:MAG: FKBP-type peptidyl-prolyl cis-trans isomerase [Dysgonamonadaceae bacterium]|jgi:FKBP-type peptidyl-prolyl cis-trans isomerase|nr:FKBP-type peptidyl-prolyl cis-trans isomerase [Dysgonamonadaceae bacterium]